MKVFLIAVVLALSATTVAAQAQDRAAIQVDARAEVAAALYSASATQAAAERVADERLRAAQSEIARLRAEGSNSRAELAAAQERYVAELARRDSAYAQEIAVFRSAVEDIASTPEGATALARFNAGDEVGALMVLDQLADARARARQVRANIETAGERRRLTTLALEARNRGRVSTQSVISRYLQVITLDSEFSEDWINLSELYQQSGNQSDASSAAARAIATARTLPEEIAAHGVRGTALQNQGDIESARLEFEYVVAAARNALQRNPNNPFAYSDLSRALSSLAAIFDRQGQQERAQAARDEALRLASQTSATNPSSMSAQRTYAIRLAELVPAIRARGDHDGARSNIEEAVAIHRRLALMQPDVREAQRDLMISLVELGDTLVMDERNPIPNAQNALSVFREALRISQNLARSDPTNHQAQADLGAVLTKVGDALYVLDDLDGARAHYTESMQIDARLLSDDPENAELARSLSIDFEKLATIAAEQANWEEATRQMSNSLAVLEQLVSRNPTNTQFVEERRSAERTLNLYRTRRSSPTK